MFQRRWSSIGMYLFASLAGIWAFLAPLFQQNLVQAGELQAGGGLAPVLLVGLVGLCYMALLAETHSPAGGATLVALLGVLIALNAALRFAETVVPGPGGFTPLFLLIILTGYVFGGRVGFLMGALSMLVSALVTGGVGPWLPYQMWAAGWVGMSARLLDPLVRRMHGRQRIRELVVLAVFGAGWGFLYGAILNLWFWPYVQGSQAVSWLPGMGLAEGLQNYVRFYLMTSFIWDVSAALGNGVLLLAFGRPLLAALRRFRTRMGFQVIALPTPVLPLHD